MIDAWVATLIVTSLSSTGSSPGVAHAPDPEQPASHKTTLITLQPFSLLSESITAGVEHAFSDKMSLVLAATVTIRNMNSQTSGNVLYDTRSFSRVVGGSVEPGLNYFLSGTAPEGLWIGPRALFQYQSTKTEWTVTPSEPMGSFSYTQGVSAKSYLLGGSLLLGYTAIFKPGFTAQVGFGLSASYAWGTGEPKSFTGAAIGGVLFGPSPNTTFNQLSLGARGLLALGWSL